MDFTDVDVTEGMDNSVDIEDAEDFIDGTSYELNDLTYATSERQDRVFTKRGDSSDGIDPRALHDAPSINEIRWYYQYTFAKKLVNKPIDDAFKTGFEIKGLSDDKQRRRINNLLYGDPDDRSQESNVVDYIDKYKLAQKKARRDGWAILFYGLRDDAEGPYQSPMKDDVNVRELTHLKVLTIDDFSSGDPTQISEQTDYEPNDLCIRDSGMVVVTDVLDKNYGRPIGYCMNDPKSTFIHRDRCQHFVWNNEVDGNFREDTLGEYEGDSILISSYNSLKGLSKGNWAIMQALFRNASQMYSVTLPEDANDEDFEEANENLQNLNAMSELVLPFGYEVTAHDAEGNMEPRDHFDIVFEEICASNEMTKSVLFGTQTGTVSGSETDMKNYFNQISRNQTERHQGEIQQFIDNVNDFNWANRSTNPVSGVDKLDIRWNPLFSVSETDRMEIFRTQANSLAMLVEGYVLTPNEARSIISEEWADIDLSDLTDSQRTMLNEVLEVGEFAMEMKETSEGQPQEEEQEQEASEQAETNPREGNNSENGGGMSEGQSTGEMASTNNDSDSNVDGVSIEPHI